MASPGRHSVPSEGDLVVRPDGDPRVGVGALEVVGAHGVVASARERVVGGAQRPGERQGGRGRAVVLDQTAVLDGEERAVPGGRTLPLYLPVGVLGDAGLATRYQFRGRALLRV